MKYKNLIFDLGNVLVRLDEAAAREAFDRLGLTPLLNPRQHPEGMQLRQALTLGHVSTAQFCERARQMTGQHATDDQIVQAANRMLVEIPGQKKALLLKLRQQGFRVFLLSNTVDMHWNYCVERLFPYEGHGVDDYFEQVFLSQRMHLAKPDPKMFSEVIARTGIDPHCTLFIDDLPDNCEAARRLGIHTFQNVSFDAWLPLFDPAGAQASAWAQVR